MQAQTTLDVGDVAVIYLQTGTPDDFGFVTFVNLEGGTKIYFTDCGADANGFPAACAAADGAVLYTAPSAVAAGTYIRFSTATGFTNYSDSKISRTTGVNLSSSGDQIVVFQDIDEFNAVDASDEPFFIWITNNASSAFTGDPADPQQTGLPTGLSDTPPVSALALGSGTGTQDEFDNTVYDGSQGSGFNDIPSMIAAFTDASNYTQVNNTTDATYISNVNALSGSLLPVDLVSFWAEYSGEEVHLNWITASELNNEKFEIEQSSDGRFFTKIGEIAGHHSTLETHTYTYQVKEPRVGMNYFRLQQTDLDGQSEYSEIISVLIKETANPTGIFYPNPAPTKVINWSYPATENEVKTLTLYDYLGQAVLQKTVAVQQGENEVSFDFSALASGVYFIKIDDKLNASVEKIILK